MGEERIVIFSQIILIATIIAAYVVGLWSLRALFDKIDEPDDFHGADKYKEIKGRRRRK